MEELSRLPLSPFEKKQRKLAELIDALEYYKLLLQEEYQGDWGGLTTESHLGELWNSGK